MNISVIEIRIFRFYLFIILISSTNQAAYQDEQCQENWKLLNLALAKLRDRREEPSFSELDSLFDDNVANYYSTILHRGPNAEKSYLSQILNQVSYPRKHKLEDSRTLKKPNNVVAKSVQGSSNQTSIEPVHSTSQQITTQEYTTSNVNLVNVSNASSSTAGLSTENTTKFTIPTSSSIDGKPSEGINITTESSQTLPVTSLTASSSNNYAPILVLMARKFDEIEKNLQTFKANQMLLAHKVKNISNKLEAKEIESTPIIRPDIDKIIEQLVSVRTVTPGSSYEAPSNLTDVWI